MQCIGGCGIFVGCLQCYGRVLAEFWRDGILEKPLAVFGGVWHFWRALAVFWRGVAFLESVAFLVGACRVLEGCGILEKPLAVVWRSAAFLEGACSVMEGCLQSFGGVWHFGEATCRVFEECGIFGGRLQHFGGA